MSVKIMQQLKLITRHILLNNDQGTVRPSPNTQNYGLRIILLHI